MLAHRESGLTGLDAIHKRRSLDTQIENEIEEQVNLVPIKPLSPIKDTNNNANPKKNFFHPYILEKPKKVLPHKASSPLALVQNDIN